jgi:cold shock CspA family protein
MSRARQRHYRRGVAEASGVRQATVHRYDPETASGSVLLDDGVDVPFDAAALQGSGLRLLRVGQRVRIRVAGDRVSALTLATFPL